METIYDALRADHDLQRELMGAVLETSGDNEERRTRYDRLKLELTAHATYEERHFYTPLIQSDLTQDKARHSVSEHQELDDFVQALDDYDMAGPQWIQTARELAAQLEHHLSEEEQQVFPLSGKVLTDQEKTALAVAYQAGMDESRQSA